MTSIALLGATGNVGRHVAAQSLQRGWQLSVAVRTPHRLAPEVAKQARITTMDLSTAPLAEIAQFAKGHDVLVCCAGLVTEGEAFVALIDRVVSALESLDTHQRPVTWWMAGAALLDLDEHHRRGIDLPKVRTTYWPHRANFERLQPSPLNWRLLCPGPMVEQPALGIERLRISIDTLPASLLTLAKHLPGPLVLPLFAMKVPEMIISYADAAALMLANVDGDSPMARRRVGVALPVGMRGVKGEWAAKA